MNAAHSIAPQAQPPKKTEAKAARTGPRGIEGAANHLSPALVLQSRLNAALETEHAARWPGYVRVPLLFGGAIVAWGAILTTALRLFH